MFEIKSPFLVFLITFIGVSQDEEFMQRKEKALKTVTDIFVSMLDFFLFMAKWVILVMTWRWLILYYAASTGFSQEKIPVKLHVETGLKCQYIRL